MVSVLLCWMRMRSLLPLAWFACTPATDVQGSRCIRPLRISISTDAVATGGSSTAVPRCMTTHDPIDLADFDGEFVVDDGGGTAVRATGSGRGAIDLVGVQAGSNPLRLFDPDGELLAYTTLDAEDVDTIELDSKDPEADTLDGATAPAGFAWAPGAHAFSLAISGRGRKLVDLGARAMLGDQVLAGTATITTPGDYVIAAHAGRLDVELPITVTDVADHATAALFGNTATGTAVCFFASTAGRVIVGLPWTFTVDGDATTGRYNCVSVSPGSHDVVGHAAGQTASLTLLARPSMAFTLD